MLHNKEQTLETKRTMSSLSIESWVNLGTVPNTQTTESNACTPIKSISSSSTSLGFWHPKMMFPFCDPTCLNSLASPVNPLHRHGI